MRILVLVIFLSLWLCKVSYESRIRVSRIQQTQEQRSPDESIELSEVLSFQSRVGQNVNLHALPAATNLALALARTSC